MWARRALAAVAFWLIHSSVLAAPAVSVEGADAHCPARATVEREIRQFTADPGPGEPHFRLEITQLPGGARADLLNPAGERLFTRRIESDDCEALARAFSLILHAHFVDLGIVEGRLPPTSGVPDEAAESRPEPEPDPPPPAEQQPPAQRTIPTPARGHAAETGAQASSQHWGYRLGAGLGIGYDLPDRSPMLAGALQAGAVTPGGLWLAMHCRGASPVRVGTSPNRVERWPLALELGVSRRFFGKWWLEPGVGAGVQLSRVRALDIDSGARLSVVPVAHAALRAGLSFSSISPWLELGGQLVLDRDRYVVQPRGAIGLGPRATLLLLLGVDTTWF